MCVAFQLSPVDGAQRAEQEVGNSDRKERKEEEELQLERTSVAKGQEGDADGGPASQRSRPPIPKHASQRVPNDRAAMAMADKVKGDTSAFHPSDARREVWPAIRRSRSELAPDQTKASSRKFRSASSETCLESSVRISCAKVLSGCHQHRLGESRHWGSLPPTIAP